MSKFKEIRQKAGSMLAGAKSKGSFTQNLAVVFSGNMVAYAITLIFTPIISRIYTPEAYGSFSLFLSITTNLMLFGTLSYSNALVLPKSRERFVPLVQLNMLIGVVFCTLLFLATALFGKRLLLAMNAESLVPIRFLIPFIVLIATITYIWQGWNMREKEFRRGAATLLVSSLLSRSVTLLWGFTRGGTMLGLVLGEVVVKLTEVLLLASKKVRSQFQYVFKKPDPARLIATAKFYKGYPLFTLPAMWFMIFKGQIPVYVLTYFFDIGLTGQFSYANALLAIPLTLIANSTSPVFLQRATEAYRQGKAELNQLVRKFSLVLLYLAVLPFVILTVFGDWIFRIFLGPQWVTAGIFAGAMGFYFLFFTISTPLTNIYRVIHQEKYVLIFNVVNLVLIGLFVVPGIVWGNAFWVIVGFSVANVLAAIFNFLKLFQLLGLPYGRFILKTIGLPAVCYVVLLAVRWGIEQLVF